MSSKSNCLHSQINLAVVAHVDAGKTTLSERFLYYAGKIENWGLVEEGLTTLDYLEEEKKRGVTIDSGAISF